MAIHCWSNGLHQRLNAAYALTLTINFSIGSSSTFTSASATSYLIPHPSAFRG
ncbi:MAG: hypothetical protein KME17_17565 [Cyanosarcina radialis HA8281-LM2]|nr:hypothetical protein [Cyanosarcina radialis HA8281-LM2]